MNRVIRARAAIGCTKYTILGVLGSLIVLASLHAQTATKEPGNANTTAAATSTPVSAQAPEDVTKKITDLVNAGRYAEAQALTTGLLVAYPNDQRLIKTQVLLKQLLASAAAAPSTANSSPSVQPSSDTDAGQLTGADKLDYNVLIELARQAQQTGDLPQQTELLQQFMKQSSVFLQKYPEQMLLWQLRAASAISLNEPMAGYEAAQKLLAAGAMDSNDPKILHLLAKLKLLEWLDKNKAEGLQMAVDKEKQQQASATEAARLQAEREKYTFPVMHGRFPCCGYGRLTLDQDDATYRGNDGTVRFAKDDIVEIKTICTSKMGCGLMFYLKQKGSHQFTAVTAQSVDDMHSRNVTYPPSVLGNAVVARWKFVSDGKNGLKPPSP